MEVYTVLPIISAYVGHSGIRDTEYYLRNDQETTRQAIENASSSLVLDENVYLIKQKQDMMDFL